MVHTQARPGTRRTIDQTVNDIAVRQHGLVTRAQLVRAGVTPDVIDGRIRTGRLTIVQRGVYSPGPPTAQYARQMAAVLTCGEAACLSHRSAARLWRMLPLRDDDPQDVIVRRGRRRQRRDVRVHTTALIRTDECTRLHGIPITTPTRTLLDIATVVSLRGLERALSESLALRLTTERKVRAIAARNAGRAGALSLSTLLGIGAGPARTRSVAEDQFLDLVRAGQLPEPQVNGMVEGFEVDFAWATERLVVEVDGRAYHSTNRAIERDHQRDAVLLAHGWRVMRVTWHQITSGRDILLVQLAQALARSTPS